MPYKDPERQRAAQAAWVRNNRAKANETKRARRKTLLAYIHEQKDRPCMDCGLIWPSAVMEFHHVRGEKVARVGEMANQCYTVEAIDAEIAKCDLICANCHRLRHL